MTSSKQLNTQLCLSLQPLLFSGDIKKLFNKIDKLVERHGDLILLSINQFISSPFNLSLLLNQILKNELLLAQVQRESYYHENGFHKIVLAAGKFFKLRLHHFGGEAKIPMENIHDHRWAFASTILSGSLKMDLSTTGDNVGEKLFHYKYDSFKPNGSYEIELLGYTRVRVHETREYCKGQQYLMSTKELHRIVNKPGEESITLILTGKPVSVTCNLYAKRLINEEEKSPSRYDDKALANMLVNISKKVFTLN